MARVHGIDERWKYLNSFLPKETEFAKRAKEEAIKLNKEKISISPYEAHLIDFFIRLCQCKKFVEIGTLTGYSGLKILEALPKEGHLWTFELNSDIASFASKLFDGAGFRGRYTILVGRAEELLPSISSQAPFDGVFIDANKSSYPFYLDWSLNNLKPGGLFLADNTLMNGVVPHSTSSDVSEGSEPEKMIRELRRFNQNFMNHPLITSMMIPTQEGLSVGVKNR